jgi:hypothetical protein
MNPFEAARRHDLGASQTANPAVEVYPWFLRLAGRQGSRIVAGVATLLLVAMVVWVFTAS